ncbi:hypothetical protein DFS34DRAFT_409992 [Phlyctochytrium arcticum]|nr:hypothetical protein DFS34DRAFT_409992 [Phlyctochytrium arcticum]
MDSHPEEAPFPVSSLEAAVHLGTKEFIKGFVAGQITLGFLIFFLVKVFFFHSGESSKRASEIRKHPQITSKLAGCSAQESPLVSKIGFDIKTNPAESCDWLNALLAQAITLYRNNVTFNTRIVQLLDDVMNGHTKPGFLGPIHITDFSLGDEFPVIHGVRTCTSRPSENLRTEIDIQLDDQIMLGIDTQFLVNWPRPAIAALPISLTISVVKMSATLVAELVDIRETNETYLSLSVMDNFILEFEVRSLVGHRTKVKDLPKLASIITSKLRAVFIEELVWPTYKRFRVPMFWDDAQEEAVREELEDLVEEIKQA